MKFGSKLSLAIALSLGVVPLMSASVAAKKEKKAKAPEAPSRQLSKEFRAAIAPAQAKIAAGDFVGALAAIDTATPLANNPDEKYVLGQFLVNLGSTKKDPALQSKGVYNMIASGVAPSAELPRLNFYAGNFAYQAQDYANAVRYFTEAEKLGNPGSDAPLMLAETNFKLNQVPAGLAALDRAVTSEEKAGRKAPENWYSRGSAMAYRAKLDADIAKWTSATVRAYPSPENWRSALVTYRDSGRIEGQAILDIYRLMRVTKSLKGERDYFEYAATSNERGLPGEAKAVIDEGYASSAISRSSRPIAEMYTLASGKIGGDRATLGVSERQAASAANGRVAANTGDAYLGYGDDAKAVTLYKAALQKGGVDADAVNTRLGIALARMGQKDEARAALTKVAGPRAAIARFWLTYLDLTV